jgi:hypothetical protein
VCSSPTRRRMMSWMGAPEGMAPPVCSDLDCRLGYGQQSNSGVARWVHR